MEQNKPILNYMANRDVFLYNAFLKYHSEKDEFHNYEFLASVDEYSIYDGMQIKTDLDGDINQQFIELKGRYCNISDFNDCAIDGYKIKQLQKLAYCSNIPTYIIAIYYPDSKLVIWRIDDEKEYETVILECQQSQIDTTKQDIIAKEMVKLPLEDGKIFKIPQYITNQALKYFKKY